MNRIPKGEPSLASNPRTYVCNRFALHPIIFNEEFHMETTVQEIAIDESDYTANLHSCFHLYSTFITIINFKNRFWFPTLAYAYSMPTTPSVHMLTTEELLDRPIGVEVEPADEQLLDTPIFDLNIGKLPLSTDASALPMLAMPSDITVTATQITDFLKVTLDEISNIAPAPMDESTPIQPAAMDTEMTTTTDQMLTDIPEESTVDQSTSMDLVLIEPATMMPTTIPTVDPRIYLATPAVLPRPPIIATIAAARYSAPVHFLQHIISDHQWQALAAALTAYHFLLRRSMLFPEHHWMDYPDALKEEIQRILLPQLTPTALVPQIAQTALVIAQTAIQPLVTLSPPIALQLPPVPQPPQPATLVRPTAPVDVQTPQAPSMSALALDRHRLPIRKPGCYEHSVKRKQRLHKEAEYGKSHKTCTMNEPRTKQTPPHSTLRVECGKMPSK
uniref:Uncharacterized protein n=1 Tax=Romanomermis culicivorax TaxID=13658 RepID=A0A915JAM1_ROMCU